MECLVGNTSEMMFQTADESSYKCDENRQLHCQELIELNDQIAQDNVASHMNDYAILPAVNLCPIWGISNLEVVETGQSGFVEVGNVATSSVPTSTGRPRRKPRPYSPSDLTTGSKKQRQKPKVIRVQRINSSNDVYIDKRTGLPFSCDKCESPHIVDPTRCSPGNRKRPPMPRKYVDPVSGRVMMLCNACGIAAKTNRKDRPAKVIHDAEKLLQLKNDYLTESMNFAKKLSLDCNEPDLAMLYCPSFSVKGCGCIEKYLFSEANSATHETQLKALDLLSYHRRAEELNRNGRFSNASEDDYCNVHSENELHIDECEDNLIEGFRKPHYKCKSRDFEKFVLSSRIKLRTEYALCEKATKKILMYSNNFLHKESKTAPQRGPRVDKVIKRTTRLKPISEMHKEHCCSNGCTRIALSHVNLLEDWRKRASVCQKDARRVIAEMLTPTGGTKANCYRFIKMVTGSCVATIFLVNDHMKKTKGDREPPEHGLKRYWRRNSKSHKATSKIGESTSPSTNLLSEPTLIPSDEELLSMGTEAASALLQAKKQQLEYLQSKLQKAESRLKAAAEITTVVAQENIPQILVNELRDEVQNNIFILGQDGVIRPWKADPQYVHITATQDNT
ncbi:uncharacterized protein LOC124176757 isoform X1 [Neodiprion fabricii]|uniref:uncharacterized protein LOC124176757 isoform X1 n=2 Tax=Neodiprion fabricii TaxID=2872261 RepID=UPI001ED97199|nr:uncharacterized protein LOC124176757 isoform X1 [Neodiprion fabricii]XP_046414366.1 uncharacterized protein LOC124176757 isoform X1 [Neodiprion fabricii]